MRVFLAVITLAATLLPGVPFADRGALSIDGGAVVSVARVRAGVGTGDSVVGTLAGATVGARYAVANQFEFAASGVWFNSAAFANNSTTITRPGSAPFTGQLQSQVSRIGAAIGAQYVKGLVLRFRVGGEVGWARVSFRRMDLINGSTDPPASYGDIGDRDRTLDAVVVAPMAGIEWMATDHLSFAMTPRIEFLLGQPQLTAVTIPITVSYSWYGWLR
jgi:hypothetical protein